MGYSFRLTARVLLYAQSYSCGALAGTRNKDYGDQTTTMQVSGSLDS